MFQAPAIQVIAGKEDREFSCQTGRFSDTFARPLASNSRGEASETRSSTDWTNISRANFVCLYQTKQGRLDARLRGHDGGGRLGSVIPAKAGIHFLLNASALCSRASQLGVERRRRQNALSNGTDRIVSHAAEHSWYPAGRKIRRRKASPQPFPTSWKREKKARPMHSSPTASALIHSPPTRSRWAVSTIFFINGMVLASWVPHIPAVKA